MKVGFTKLSTIDYPGDICSMIFFTGCNFSCGYCHNVDVNNGNVDYDLESVLKELEADYHIISSVCLSGGEPTINKSFIKVVDFLYNKGFSIKLDTNGSNYKVLKEVANKLDYIAMDIKAPLRKYQEIANYQNTDNIKMSIELIKTLPRYEFRTTVSPSFLGEEDIKEIATMLTSAKRYVLQGYKKIPGSYEAIEPTKEWLEDIAYNIKGYFGEVIVKGGR